MRRDERGEATRWMRRRMGEKRVFPGFPRLTVPTGVCTMPLLVAVYRSTPQRFVITDTASGMLGTWLKYSGIQSSQSGRGAAW